MHKAILSAPAETSGIFLPDATSQQGVIHPASRRSFLGRGIAAASATAALAIGSSSALAQSSGGPPSLYPGWNRRNFLQIRTNENSHLSIILFAIQSLGGTPRPRPTFRNLVASTFAQFVELSATFENLGTRAYQGASPYIFNPDVAAVAGSLAFVEAYQAGFLNTLLNRPLVPNGATYSTPATPPEVNAAFNPFIVSLNDNGLFPPTYATTKSPENDIAILNFALIDEYLENEFYNVNLPRFFSGV